MSVNHGSHPKFSHEARDDNLRSVLSCASDSFRFSGAAQGSVTSLMVHR